MKILIYGAGPLGSLFAARLHEAGYEVFLLARGQRLADLRQHGIVLVDTQTNRQTTTHLQLVEQLDPQEAYELVLVIMRKNRALEILPILAADEFIALAKQTTIPTPYIDRLYSYFKPATPPLPEGSAQLPLDWRFFWTYIGVIATIMTIVIIGLALLFIPRQKERPAGKV